MLVADLMDELSKQLVHPSVRPKLTTSIIHGNYAGSTLSMQSKRFSLFPFFMLYWMKQSREEIKIALFFPRNVIIDRYIK